MGYTTINPPYYAQLMQNQKNVFVPPNQYNTAHVWLNALEGESEKLDKKEKTQKRILYAGLTLVGLALFIGSLKLLK